MNDFFLFQIYYNFYKDIRPFTIDTAPGYVDMPVEVDVMVQILTINDVNLNDETVDLNIALSMMWTDYRLAWNIEDFNGIKSIEVDPRPSFRGFQTSLYISEPRLGHFLTFLAKTRKSLVWVPDLEIVNRVPSEWIDGRTASKARIFYTGRWGSPDQTFERTVQSLDSNV